MFLKGIKTGYLHDFYLADKIAEKKFKSYNNGRLQNSRFYLEIHQRRSEPRKARTREVRGTESVDTHARGSQGMCFVFFFFSLSPETSKTARWYDLQRQKYGLF